MTKTKKVKVEAKVAKFTKEQLLASKKFAKRRDLVGALLNDDELYTVEQVDAAIAHYMKGKVK